MIFNYISGAPYIHRLGAKAKKQKRNPKGPLVTSYKFASQLVSEAEPNVPKIRDQEEDQ